MCFTQKASEYTVEFLSPSLKQSVSLTNGLGHLPSALHTACLLFPEKIPDIIRKLESSVSLQKSSDFWTFKSQLQVQQNDPGSWQSFLKQIFFSLLFESPGVGFLCIQLTSFCGLMDQEKKENVRFLNFSHAVVQYIFACIVE